MRKEREDRTFLGRRMWPMRIGGEEEDTTTAVKS